MFKITDGKGFQMTFVNGWTVSVQFGPWNYCDNRDINPRSGESFARMNCEAGKKGSNTAEIAAWNKNGKWLKFDNDTVNGWVTPDDVAKFINEIANKEE
jgi:hypothetical protein